MTRVFISSSSLDAEFVEREIVSPLKRHGLEVWYSKDNIETAAEWEKRIKHGLNACEWFLVVLSPRSVASDWVQSEVDWALEKRGGRVVPVLYDDCDPGDLHLKLRRIQYIDFRHDPRSARRKLLAVWGLHNIPEVENPAPPRRLPLVTTAPAGATTAAADDTAEGVPRARRVPGGAAFWAAIALAVTVLGLASAWGIGKLWGDPDESASPGRKAGVSSAGGQGSAPAQGDAAALQGIEPLSITQVESYQLVLGKENTLRVRMVVDHAPDELQVELGGRQALITRNQQLPGGEGRRDISATINFGTELQWMKRRPDKPLPLLIKVFDGGDADNYEIQELEIEPYKLGIEDRVKPPTKTAVRVEQGKTKRVDGTSRPLRQPTPASTPTPTQKQEGKNAGAAPRNDSDEPPITRPTPHQSTPTPARAKPTPTPKPCPWNKKALGLC